MGFQMKGRMIFFATNNVNKFNEARRVLAVYKIAAGMLRIKAFEIQSDNLEEVAKTSVVDSFQRCNLPLIVEDAGLFIEILNGFPGPYAAYVYRTIGNRGLLKLMADNEDRKVKFQSVVAYYSSELKSPICFKGEVKFSYTIRQIFVKPEPYVNICSFPLSSSLQMSRCCPLV